MATILHNQPIIRITDWLAAVCASLSVAKDLIYALNKIKTDKVDMDQFVSQLFRERYLCAPSNQTRQNPERYLELVAEIYASVYNAIAH